jgi:predicted metal-dependent RNase
MIKNYILSDPNSRLSWRAAEVSDPFVTSKAIIMTIRQVVIQKERNKKQFVIFVASQVHRQERNGNWSIGRGGARNDR